MVIGFKTIRINVFEVIIVKKMDDDFRVIFKHANYHLWESSVRGFLCKTNNDYIIVNKDGMNFIRLDTKVSRRSIKDKDGSSSMVHSLESMNYLKIEKGNMILFDNIDPGYTELQIQQQQTDLHANTSYEVIFKIKLEAMKLQDLILIQSIFLLDSCQDILRMIDKQPDKSLFFKSFMELDHANLIQILCFDSRIIKKLLNNMNEKLDQPLFYKMQQNYNGMVEMMTPIDVALESNQMVAINKIIDYCIKYQNQYCFSFLFEERLVEIIEKGIKVAKLFESNIFSFSFELDDWPAIHRDGEAISMPYNGSKFELMGKYRTLFSQLDNDEIEQSPNASYRGDKKSGQERQPRENEKYFKIKYSLNILPAATYRDGECVGINDLLDCLGSTNELEIFDTKIVRDFYEFEWINFAMHIHYLGALLHFIYMITFVVYVNEVYLYRDFTNRVPMLYIMLVIKMYPMYYDTLQLINQGAEEYFSEAWNFVDQSFIWVGLTNIIIQRSIADILYPGS